MSTPSLTIESHLETPDGFVLTVRVAETAPDCFATVAGDARADGADTLIVFAWPTDVPADDQRREARLLIEHALAPAAAPEPVEVTAPGTEL
ncbi:unannotated protein [freshwater metagenome]|uniref:Unannotated protein n=1 Tax=freshwater metagenome TaxID=449393 RepID=A0A6J7FLZ9_9ZZZZ|nr:hypothetical protein [Actinomycetota bacterium]